MVNETEKPQGTPPADQKAVVDPNPPNSETNPPNSETNPPPGDPNRSVDATKQVSNEKAPVPENEPSLSFTDAVAAEGRASEDGADPAEETAPPEPNIIFVRKRRVIGEDGEAKLIPADPPASIRDGVNFYTLPGAAEQREGFYHPSAGAIVRAFPDAYKAFVRKGEK